MNELNELKAQAYDKIAAMEKLQQQAVVIQQELKEINDKIIGKKEDAFQEADL